MKTAQNLDLFNFFIKILVWFLKHVHINHELGYVSSFYLKLKGKEKVMLQLLKESWSP